MVISSVSGRETQDLAAADQAAGSTALTDVCRQARARHGGAARRGDRDAIGSRRRARWRLAAGTRTLRRSDVGAERTVRVSARTLTAVGNRKTGQGRSAAARSHADLAAGASA